MLKAFHITHTRPYHDQGATFHIEDFELLTTILSALQWRRKNGSIRLYTDSVGKEYYEREQMTFIWDEGINIQVLENIKETIDFSIFWAGGKLFALKDMPTPCVMIDTDFIVWENLSSKISNVEDVISIHREELMEGVYLPEELLKKAPNYRFDEKWDWNEKAANTALLYMGNNTLKEYYTSSAIKFMQNNLERPSELISQIVFAEQRLLAMCAKSSNVELKSFCKEEELQEQNSYTHLWGYKQTLRDQPDVALKFCTDVVTRLVSDFEEYNKQLYSIPVVRRYL